MSNQTEMLRHLPKMLAVDVLAWDERPGSTIDSYREPALSNLPQRVKCAFTRVYGWVLYNPNIVPVFLKLYNQLVSDVEVGTTEPALTLCIPPGTTDTPGIYIQNPDIVPFHDFSEALSVAVTTGLSDDSTTAPATPVHVHIKYK
jgi:hypothetical protein